MDLEKTATLNRPPVWLLHYSIKIFFWHELFVHYQLRIIIRRYVRKTFCLAIHYTHNGKYKGSEQRRNQIKLFKMMIRMTSLWTLLMMMMMWALTKLFFFPSTLHGIYFLFTSSIIIKIIVTISHLLGIVTKIKMKFTSKRQWQFQH